MTSSRVLVYLDNVIFHRLQRRLSDRNHACRRRSRYLISANFQYYCYQNALSPALCNSAPQLGNIGSHPCRVPHRITGHRAPRPHDPPLMVRYFGEQGSSSSRQQRRCVIVCGSPQAQLSAGSVHSPIFKTGSGSVFYLGENMAVARPNTRIPKAIDGG